MQKAPFLILAILLALQRPLGPSQSQEHDYLIYWHDGDVSIRLRIESQNEVYSEALNKEIFIYTVKVQKRNSRGVWYDLDLCEKKEGYVFGSNCGGNIKLNAVKITSEIEMGDDLKEKFESDAEQRWPLSRYLNRHVLRNAPNYESHLLRPSQEKGILRTQYYVFSSRGRLRRYLDKPAKAQKSSAVASPKSYPLRISFLEDKDHDFDELRKKGDPAYTIVINGVSFVSKKSPATNTVSFDDSFKVEVGKDIVIELRGTGFKRLKAGEKVRIPYRDWTAFVDKQVITLKTKKLKSLLCKEYSLFFEDLPSDLVGELYNISINGTKSDPMASLNQKGKGLTFVDFYYDQGKRDLVFSLGDNESFFDYEDWREWVSGNSIKVPWGKLNKEGLFDRTYSFRADLELTRELRQQTISLAGVRIEGPSGISESLNFDLDGYSANARKKLPYSQDYVLKFPKNLYFNGGTIRSRDLISVSGKYQLSMNKLKKVLNAHEWADFESTEGERLPNDWPRLFFTGSASGPQALTETIKKTLKTDLYTFKKVGTKVKVTRKSLMTPLDYNCSMSFGSWVGDIQVMDRDFINQGGNSGYTLKSLADNDTKVALKATRENQIELRFRLKNRQRGLKYPNNLKRDIKGEYFSVYWNKNANRLVTPCPEKLKPMEVVFFDAITGRDIELFRTKINELEDRHRNGEIAGFQLIFGYASDLIVALNSDQSDYRIRLQDQFGQGNQKVHLLRNYAEIPIPSETISLHVHGLERDARYNNYIINKKAYLTRSSQINMTSGDESMLEAAKVDVEYFKNN